MLASLVEMTTLLALIITVFISFLLRCVFGKEFCRAESIRIGVDYSYRVHLGPFKAASGSADVRSISNLRLKLA